MTIFIDIIMGGTLRFLWVAS